MPLKFSTPLPPGWISFRDANGLVFVNRAEKTTTYVDPRLRAFLPLSLRQLPENWELDVDENFFPYFIDHNIGTTLREPDWLGEDQVAALLSLHQRLVEEFEDKPRLANSTTSSELRHRTKPTAVFVPIDEDDTTLSTSTTVSTASLQSDWQLCTSVHGDYYHHPISGRTAWINPQHLLEYGISLEHLPPSWDALIDEYGAFLFNHHSQISFRVPTRTSMSTLLNRLSAIDPEEPDSGASSLKTSFTSPACKPELIDSAVASTTDSPIPLPSALNSEPALIFSLESEDEEEDLSDVDSGVGSTSFEARSICSDESIYKRTMQQLLESDSHFTPTDSIIEIEEDHSVFNTVASKKSPSSIWDTLSDVAFGAVSHLKSSVRRRSQDVRDVEVV